MGDLKQETEFGKIPLKMLISKIFQLHLKKKIYIYMVKLVMVICLLFWNFEDGERLIWMYNLAMEIVFDSSILVFGYFHYSHNGFYVIC